MDLGSKKLWVFDVDNTLIRDVEHPIPFPGAKALWNELHVKGKAIAIVTNVGRLSSRQVHQAVTKAGFSIPLNRVFTAGAGAAASLKISLREGSDAAPEPKPARQSKRTRPLSRTFSPIANHTPDHTIGMMRIGPLL